MSTIMRNGLILFARCRSDGECSLCPHKGKAVVYGPFPSRRRGLSLGINLFVGKKVCSFDCIYCFRGKTEIKVSNTSDVPRHIALKINAKILREALVSSLSTVEETLEAIDFSGNGEPTLHPNFPSFVDVVRDVIREFNLDVSLGIFTNASLLNELNIIKALLKLDHIEVKLDTIIEQKFKEINRPHEKICLKKIVQGIKTLREKFHGTLAIQTLLLRYGRINNVTTHDAKRLAEVLETIKPDEVHIYTVYRKPQLPTVAKVTREEVKEFLNILVDYGLNVKVYL